MSFMIYEFTPKRISPEVHKSCFLYIHRQISSKVPIFYFNGPKRSCDNFYVTCLLQQKSALNLSHQKTKISRYKNVHSVRLPSQKDVMYKSPYKENYPTSPKSPKT